MMRTRKRFGLAVDTFVMLLACGQNPTREATLTVDQPSPTPTAQTPVDTPTPRPPEDSPQPTPLTDPIRWTAQGRDKYEGIDAQVIVTPGGPRVGQPVRFEIIARSDGTGYGFDPPQHCLEGPGSCSGLFSRTCGDFAEGQEDIPTPTPPRPFQDRWEVEHTYTTPGTYEIDIGISMWCVHPLELPVVRLLGSLTVI